MGSRKFTSEYIKNIEEAHALLGIFPNDTEQEVLKKYRQYRKTWHPDNHTENNRQTAHNNFIRAKQAFDIIMEHRTTQTHTQSSSEPEPPPKPETPPPPRAESKTHAEPPPPPKEESHTRTETTPPRWKEPEPFPTTYWEAKKQGRGEKVNLYAGILSIAIFLGMIIFIFYSFHASTKTTRIRYEIHNDTAIITSLSSLGANKFFDIRNTYGNMPVTAIGDYAFYNTKIEGVTVPDGVISIGAYAFAGCKNLTTVELPNSVTSMGLNAFADSPKLTVICKKDSYTYNYCVENDIKVKTR